MELAALIDESRALLDRFDAEHYPASFARFQEQAAPLLAALTAEDPGSCAEALLDALEQRRAAGPRLLRGRRLFAQRQVLALYFTPAALAAGAGALSQQVCERWNARYPRDAYAEAGFEQLCAGFAPTSSLGIPLSFLQGDGKSGRP